jgi:hypothetical protein
VTSPRWSRSPVGWRVPDERTSCRQTPARRNGRVGPESRGAGLMADGSVHIHPAVERMALRRQMATAVERLLDTVDVLLRELASDEPDADLEPSLGAPEHPAHLCNLGGWRIPPGIFDWSQGANDDREADGRYMGTDADCEPSLGSTFRWDQRRWASSGVDDLEQEHDGREPSLASVTVERWADQRGWAAGARDDREEACEGEGDHDEREPDGYLDPDEEPSEVQARCEAGLG